MGTLTCGRLLHLFRCQNHLEKHLHARRSVLQVIPKHCSTVKPLVRWNRLIQHTRLNGDLRISWISSKFSTTTSCAEKKASNSNAGGRLNDAESKPNDFDLTGDPKKSLFKKFNENLKKYWYVMLPVHLITSGGYFVGFYYLASKGISPVPLLEKIGMFEIYLKHIQGSNIGIFAIAVIFQKIASPIRYLTTWYTVKALASRGKLLTSEQFFKLIKERYLKKKS